MKRKTRHPTQSVADEARHANASALWTSLRDEPTKAATWHALARHYAEFDLPWQEEYASSWALSCDRRPNAQFGDMVSGAGWREPDGLRLLGQSRLSNTDVLADRFAAALETCPEDWLTCLFLTRLRETLGEPETARQLMERARGLEVIEGETLHWIGVWRLRSGDARGAVVALSPLIDTRPQRHGSMMFLGEALSRAGMAKAAEEAFSRASRSSNPEFLKTLSARVYAQNYWREAMAMLYKVLALNARDEGAWLALAKIQLDTYRLAECCESLRCAVALASGNRQATLLEADLHGRMGDARKHLEMLLDQYWKGEGTPSGLASSIAMAALYQDDMSAEVKADLHRRMCAPMAEAVSTRYDFSAAGRSASSRLRIGYVSGNLHRQHPASLLLLPLLARHDRDRFEIHIYYSGAMYDEYTQRARECADRWVEAATLTDPELHRTIVEGDVDVLIDLAGHTNNHRLGVFAMRAAPVQASFIGYPHSTGLPGMDWIIADDVAVPEAHAHLCSERVARLPDSVFCWAPMDDYPLPAPRPAAAPVVFGSFNKAMKISPRTVALWAEVLQAVPDSLLLLKAPSLDDRTVRDRFANFFSRRGVAHERILFRGPSGLREMMAEYGDIDIALDPTPYNGGMTTLQALWMGVPVVSLAGDSFAGRMGASFLTALGRQDWLALDEDGYVDVAIRLTRDCAGWRQKREALRARMAASPLADIECYTRNFENLLAGLACARPVSASACCRHRRW